MVTRQYPLNVTGVGSIWNRSLQTAALFPVEVMGTWLVRLRTRSLREAGSGREQCNGKIALQNIFQELLIDDSSSLGFVIILHCVPASLEVSVCNELVGQEE